LLEDVEVAIPIASCIALEAPFTAWVSARYAIGNSHKTSAFFNIPRMMYEYALQVDFGVKMSRCPFLGYCDLYRSCGRILRTRSIPRHLEFRGGGRPPIFMLLYLCSVLLIIDHGS